MPKYFWLLTVTTLILGIAIGFFFGYDLGASS